MGNTQGELSRRIIVVTGASSGVGYAVARRLVLNERATVIAVGRRRMFRIEALARQVAEQFHEERMWPVTADMATPRMAQTLARRVQEKYGRIDGFVHAVNRVLRLTALEVSDPEFDLTMQVNVKSALYGVQAIAPVLRRQKHGGVVIYNPTPEETPAFAASEAVYAAAAHALSALTDGWRRQLTPHGVHVQEVAPVPAAENILVEFLSHDEEILDALRASVAPVRPDAEPPLLRRPDDALLRPIILSQRGGLALAQYSQR